MRLGRKGFSLVEVIVSLAIMTIVAGSIGAFMVAGNNSYMRGNREVTIQEEAQLTANQIIDLIIDVEKGLTYTPSTYAAPVATNGSTPVDENGNAVSSVPVSELRLYNSEGETSYLLRWQGGSGYSDANEIFLYEANTYLKADGTVDADFSSATPNLLAEYVTSFVVDVKNLKEKNSVDLQMEFAYKEQTYTIDETIRLRNDFSSNQTAFTWATLTISPDEVTIPQDTTYTFQYTLTGDETVVAQGVTFKVTYLDGTPIPSEYASYFTDEENGVLYVHGNAETDKQLLVTCTAKGVSGVVDTAVVTVSERGIDSIAIDPASAELQRGATQNFTCTMTGNRERIKEGVTWKLEYVRDTHQGSKLRSSITNNEGTGDTSSYQNTLAVGGNENTGTNVLRLTVTSKANPTKSAEALISVAALSGQFNVDIIPNVITPHQYTYVDPTTGESEQRLEWQIDLEVLPSWADYSGADSSGNSYPIIHSWSIKGDDDGYTFEDYWTSSTKFKYLKCLYCSTHINESVTIKAEVQLSEYDWAYPEITISLGNLTTKVDKEQPYIDSSQFVLYRNDKVKMRLMNYDGEMSKVKWKVTQLFDDGMKETTTGQKLNLTTDNRDVGFTLGGTKDSSGEFMGGQYDDSAIPEEICGVKDAHSGSRNVYDYTYGEYAYLWAKWYLDWTKNFVLKVEAIDSDTGKTLAYTQVLIPQCEIYFPQDSRSITIKQGDTEYKANTGGDGGVYNYKISINIYGFSFGRGGLCQENPHLSMIPVMKSEYVLENPSNAYFNLDGEKEDHLAIYISSQEPSGTLMVTFQDSRAISIDRVLTIYWVRSDGN